MWIVYLVKDGDGPTYPVSRNFCFPRDGGLITLESQPTICCMNWSVRERPLDTWGR
jgi:hypothetical protein